MSRDMNDHWGWIQRLVRRVSRLESGAMLENSSITNGRMRFIGGLLRIDSGGQIQVIGEWRFTGNGAITGDVVAEGKWTQNGEWEFNGPGDIAGDVDLTGNFDLTGVFKSGNVRIQDGKIYVGAGAIQVVIDGATGRITVGSMEITPATDGGAVTFTNGSKLSANESSVGLTKGTSTVRIGDATAGLLAGSTSLQVSADGVQITPSAIPTENTSGLPQGTLSITNTGFLRRAV